jgi:hypothetical protein
VILALALAVAVASCGGSAPPNAKSGCKGVPAAHRSASLNGAAGQSLLSLGATITYVCAHFGPPQKITPRAGGLVDWTYGRGDRAGMLSFKHDRVVEGAWFERGAHDNAYNITESLEAVSNAR